MKKHLPYNNNNFIYQRKRVSSFATRKPSKKAIRGGGKNNFPS